MSSLKVVDSIEYGHLPLSFLKGVSARIIAINELLPLYQKSNAAERVHLDRIYAYISDNTEPPSEPLEPDTALDDKLCSLAKGVRRFVEANDSLEPFARFAAESVAQRLELSSRCHDCATNANRGGICSGHRDDAATIAVGGHCIQSLHELFRLAMATAARWYEGFTAPPAVLKTSHAQDVQYGFTDDYHIAAFTSYCPANAPTHAVVDIEFDLKRFGRTCYLSLPYLLMHECIVHVFQSTRVGWWQTSSVTDEFSEGWMDWIAFQILKRELSGNGNGSNSADAEELTFAHVYAKIDDCLSSCEQFHRERSGVTLGFNRRPPDSEMVARSDGRLAAMAMLKLLQSLEAADACDDGELEMFHLSLSLNAAFDVERKVEQFAKFVRLALVDHCMSLEQDRRRHRLTQAVSEYIVHRDLRLLLDQIVT